jgi:hypothetical protein
MPGTKTTTFRFDARSTAGNEGGLSTAAGPAVCTRSRVGSRRAATTLCNLVAFACLATPTARAAGSSVSPREPPDGAVAGGNPVFVLAYESLDDAALRDARFRIELSTDGFRSAALTFDQREHRGGWVPGEPGTMIYRPSRPLPDGEYEWRVSSWNGLSWVVGPDRYRLRVDTVPPAPVHDLRVRLSGDGAALLLEWEPVAQDLRGGPEYVARYLVYRYVGSGPYPLAPARKVGEAADPAWTDPDPPAEPRLVLYRVDAEDLAGNSASRR